MAQLIVVNANVRYKVSRKETLATLRSVLRNERSYYRWVSVVFINDKKSRQLNRMYLAHDYPTDVLAFRLDRRALLEGEVYVNLDRARGQANKYGVPFRNEVARLVIHGLLHLLGYRDTTAPSRLKMRKKEEKYLQGVSKRTEHARKNH